MIRFVKPEKGLLEEVQRTANLDWENLKADIVDWFGETKRTLAQYVPPPPLEDNEQDNEQDNIEESGEIEIQILAEDIEGDDYWEADVGTDTRMTDTDE